MVAEIELVEVGAEMVEDEEEAAEVVLMEVEMEVAEVVMVEVEMEEEEAVLMKAGDLEAELMEAMSAEVVVEVRV